ncbi:PAS domain S-box protein, partial [bacterium]|nr:PAS domain S-box protein [bacterium]
MLETSSPLRILLVQENENDRLLFRRAFQKSDISCEIIECSRAEEALEQLGGDDSSFDVVAVDQNLTGISGMDICRKLLDKKISPPLVLLADIGSEQLVAKALRAGVHDYIIKDPKGGYLELLPMSLIKTAIRYSNRLVGKRTESRLNESEQTFKTISDKAGHGVAIADLQGNLVYVNDSFAQMHQYSIDELIGKNLSNFHNEEQMEHVNQLNDQLKQKGNYVAEEVWHKKRDNTVFPTLMSATLARDEGGEPLFMAATSIDMTKHKKAEEALQ